MPDIALRFHKDMLVCTDSISTALRRQGSNPEADLEMMMLIEQDSLQDVYRVEKMTGAQCIVAETARMLPACLAHKNMVDKLPELASIALGLVAECKPQHLLVELGHCGLPLDGSSKSSLKENRDQYARAARAFEAAGAFDGYLLSGIDNVLLLKCALMGLRMVSDRPIVACVRLGRDGLLANGRDTLEDAVATMVDLGASVAGFQSPAGPDEVVALAKRVVDACNLPVMVTLEVTKHNPRQNYPSEENPYFAPAQMFDVALALRAAGVQMLRATGDATSAYTGGLAACLTGLSVCDVRGVLDENE